MTPSPTDTEQDPPPPNHHAAYPGFSGPGGLAAALSMVVGRAGDAEVALELTGTGADDRVVDVGCGPGVAARVAARSAATVTGVEPAPVMLRVARALTWGRRQPEYLTGVAEALPLDDGGATVVWALATVHHWPDLGAALDEARRVLRPGGRFLAIERRVEEGAAGHASHGWADGQATAFAALCRTHGFTDVRVEHRTTGRRSLVAVVATRP